MTTTESSCITTLRELAQTDPGRAEAVVRLRIEDFHDREQRERQLARRVREAEQRARWAEEDRYLAQMRERDQHARRLAAMHDAVVAKARAEAEVRHEKERWQQQFEHQRLLRLLETDAHTRRLVRWLWFTSTVAVCFALAFGVSLCAS